MARQNRTIFWLFRRKEPSTAPFVLRHHEAEGELREVLHKMKTEAEAEGFQEARLNRTELCCLIVKAHEAGLDYRGVTFDLDARMEGAEEEEFEAIQALRRGNVSALLGWFEDWVSDGLNELTSVTFFERGLGPDGKIELYPRPGIIYAASPNVEDALQRLVAALNQQA